MTLKGKRANIDVTLDSGPRSVSALVFGPYLALHKGAEGRGGWRITHLPTGYQIMPAESQKQGRLLIGRLLPLDWTPDAALRNGPAVRRIAAEISSS